MRKDSFKEKRRKERKEVMKKVKWHNRLTTRSRVPRSSFIKSSPQNEKKNLDRVTNILNRLRRPLSRRFRSRSELNEENEGVDRVGSSLRNKNRVATHQFRGTKFE